MKLKNKKTGEIGNLQPYGNDGRIWVWIENTSKPEYRYNSLAELEREWEDYEEPKEYWYINTEMYEVDYYEKGKYYDIEKFNKEIGNYFETEEEAELALRKLKAWKRLKDKGFKFLGVKGLDYAIEFEVNPPYTHIIFDEYTATEEQKEFYNDLILLFGGEE